MGDTLVWSYGGGVQTAAMAVMIVEGALPRPDITVMADTGREATATWDYLRDVLGPYLATVGVTVEIAPHTLARVDLCDPNGTTLIPAYSAEGRKSAFCSGEWKRDVVYRFLRSKGVQRCRQWLGISWEERHRARSSSRKWAALEYPLVDRHITRDGCLRLAEAAGLPPPPKSSCWCCPHRGDKQWRLLRDRYPDDWAAAIALDEQIREADERGGLWLHKSRVPLAMAPIDEPQDGQMELFPANCSSGYCWT